MRCLPGAVRNQETERWELGLIEIFVPVLPNGRCQRTPIFRPIEQLTTIGEREVVLAWGRRHRPDLLPVPRRSHRL